MLLQRLQAQRSVGYPKSVQHFSNVRGLKEIVATLRRPEALGVKMLGDLLGLVAGAAQFHEAIEQAAGGR